MIKEEKIRMMTQVAMIQKREERRAIEICGYRKKDYVSIQMIKIWICYTMAYLLLTLIGVICQYRQHLMALEDYYTERSQINDSSAGTTAKDK